MILGSLAATLAGVLAPVLGLLAGVGILL